MTATVVDLEQYRHLKWIAGAARRRTLAALGLHPDGKGGLESPAPTRHRLRPGPSSRSRTKSEGSATKPPTATKGPAVTDDLCPMCRRPMPEAKPTGRARVWCSDRCRKAARGRSPAELEANRRRLAEVNARLSASPRGIR